MEQYRKSPRADFLNYDEGDYFVTICTRNMSHYFGEIENGVMFFSRIGEFADRQLKSYADFNDDICVLLYVVMPNHIHAVIGIRRHDNASRDFVENSGQRTPNPSLRIDREGKRHVTMLSRYISSLKGSITKYAKSINADFGWQSRYHDHLIRNNRDGNNISDYIINNVARWNSDCYNGERRF